MLTIGLIQKCGANIGGKAVQQNDTKVSKLALYDLKLPC